VKGSKHGGGGTSWVSGPQIPHYCACRFDLPSAMGVVVLGGVVGKNWDVLLR
jgi:hypothetical protein